MGYLRHGVSGDNFVRGTVAKLVNNSTWIYSLATNPVPNITGGLGNPQSERNVCETVYVIRSRSIRYVRLKVQVGNSLQSTVGLFLLH